MPRKAIKIIAWLALCAGSAAVSLRMMRERPTLGSNTAEEREVLYLPSGKALKFMSLGYQNVLADALWFKTISYFGRHYRSDQRYTWFGHMCGLVTDLDPRAPGIAEFCSAMLTWEANDPKRAVEILTKAIESRPPEYFTLYLRGFTQLHFLNDLEGARRDFTAAAKFPDANITVKRLAASTTIVSGDPENAIMLILDLLKRAGDDNQRRALESRLKDARYELDLRAIDKAASIFSDRFGRKPRDIKELVDSTIISNLPRDPFEGVYYLDPRSGAAASTSAHPRLKIFKRSG